MLAFAGSASAAPCMDDAFGEASGCTANDFGVSSVDVTQVTANESNGGNGTFTFDGNLIIIAGNPERYDLGFYIATDGGDAKTGSCFVAIRPPTPGDGTDDGDSCGDYVGGGAALSIAVTGVTVPCADANGDGFYDFSLCAAYDNVSGATCNGPADAVPGGKPKCACSSVETNVTAPHCEDDATLCDAPNFPDDGNPCTDTVCNSRASGLGNAAGCSNNNDNANTCDDGNFCNGAESCSAGTCQSTGDPCAAGGVCNNVCNEGADNCLSPGSTECRASAGACDVAENCTGDSPDCPADNFANSGQCRTSAGDCDVAESCDGSGASCPADDFADSGVCRAATGECDVAESCNGSSADCPADGFVDSGTGCTSDGNACTDDECDGAGNCANTNNTDACDDGSSCTESDACSGSLCSGTPVVCDDGIDCTDDSCDEVNGCEFDENDANCDDADACTADRCSDQTGCASDFICGTDICRSPGFWSTHSGYEKDNSLNIGQLLIEEVGPIEVCGQTISTTSNGSSPYLAGLGLTSSLEGLCKRTQGVKQRSLYRQLVATALNCPFSGGGCDGILSKYVDVSFSDCSDLCAGNPVVDGPTESQCISQLDCFNNGGQVVDGKCAHGTCADQPEIYCGGGYGSCPDFADLPQECVDFPANCHSMPLCNEGLGFCPKSSKASSPAACREARFNSCTIDSCN